MRPQVLEASNVRRAPMKDTALPLHRYKKRRGLF